MKPRKTKSMKINPDQQQINTEILIELKGITTALNKLVIPEVEEFLPNYQKFIVYHEPYRIYTTIAARNIHHAANKATKLFKGNFTGILLQNHPGHTMCCDFMSVAKFNAIINSYEKLTR